MRTYLTLVLLAGSLAVGRANTTIDPTNHFAFGANCGWMDWRGDATNGVVIGQYFCSGSIYAANVGWISLGNGSPANSIGYSNAVAADYGVNVGISGNLSGLAWGANIGWVVFETNGAPRVDLTTGLFSGYAWSANCGWISLSNATAFVQTDTIVDYLLITACSFSPQGTTATLTWTSLPTRHYYIQKSQVLGPASWADSGLGLITPDGAFTTRSFSDAAAPKRFYRVEAVRTLSP